MATTCSRCRAAARSAWGSRPRRSSSSDRGTLWTWTIQGFPPKAPPFIGDDSPKTFRPFGVGYVELPGEVKVEARLTVADPEQLRIGMEMQLVIEPIGADDEGNEIVTFAFAPVAATAGAEEATS